MRQPKHENKKEDWMNSKWRPMMGWMYMLVCFMDFVGFPILWSLLQSISHGNVSSQWQPLTLQGAGLFHIAMGAVIGISAYGRTQEKLGGAAGGTTYIPPGQGQVNISNQPGMNNNMSGGFGGGMNTGMSGGFGGISQSNGFNSGTSFSAPAPQFNQPSPAFATPKPTPAAPAAFASDPSDPPTRNTRNDV